MTQMLISQEDFFFLGEFTLSLRDRSLNKSGQKTFLRPKAFEVLLMLIQNRGRIVTKGDLLDSVWPDVEVTEASLSHTIHELRTFLGDSPDDPKYIQTIPRVGYRLADWAAETSVKANGPALLASSRISWILLPFLVLCGFLILSFWGGWGMDASDARRDNASPAPASGLGIIMTPFLVSSDDERLPELAQTVYNLAIARISQRSRNISLFTPRRTDGEMDPRLLERRLNSSFRLVVEAFSAAQTVTLAVRLSDLRDGRILYATTIERPWNLEGKLKEELAEALARDLVENVQTLNGAAPPQNSQKVPLMAPRPSHVQKVL